MRRATDAEPQNVQLVDLLNPCNGLAICKNNIVRKVTGLAKARTLTTSYGKVVRAEAVVGFDEFRGKFDPSGCPVWRPVTFVSLASWRRWVRGGVEVLPEGWRPQSHAAQISAVRKVCEAHAAHAAELGDEPGVPLLKALVREVLDVLDQ